MVLLPEEEEYEAAGAAGGIPVSRSVHEEAKELITLAFGIAIVLGFTMIGLIAAYALTRWGILLLLNLFVAVLAMIAFMYLLYRRSRLTMRL